MLSRSHFQANAAAAKPAVAAKGAAAAKPAAVYMLLASGVAIAEAGAHKPYMDPRTPAAAVRVLAAKAISTYRPIAHNAPCVTSNERRDEK